MVVSIDTAGDLRFGTDDKPVTIDSLTEKLIAAVAKTPDLKLAISADTKAPWGKVVKVMDATKLAKVKPGNVSAFMKEAKQ